MKIILFTALLASAAFALPPVCSPGATQTARAGAPLTLDGSASTGTGTLTYTWQHLSGGGTPVWSSQTTVAPTVSGLTFGPHVFQLSVRDSLGVSTVCSVEHGVSATDANGVVITDNPTLDHLISPLLIKGKTPWAWTDTVMGQSADNLLALQSAAGGFLPYWRSTLTGTISLTPNTSYTTSTFTGTSTHFQDDFCNGGTVAPASPNANFLTVAHPSILGGLSYRAYGVSSCPSQTSIIVGGSTYWTSTSLSGLAYGKETEAEIALWINGSNNANYYDNGLAFETMYYQTGLSKYHIAFQTLMDRWWEGFHLGGTACYDYGYTGAGYEGAFCSGSPRMFAMKGLYLRALEVPAMWPGIYLVLNHLLEYNTARTFLVDTREEAARMAEVCIGAMFIQELGLTPPNLAAYKTFCGTMVTRLNALVQSDGSFRHIQYTYGTANNGPAVIVTNGSPIVTASGGTFDCGQFDTGASSASVTHTRPWFYPLTNGSEAGQLSGDAVSYSILPGQCSTTTLTLSSNYAGTSGTKGVTLGWFGGQLSQPFMVGYAAHALELASQALTVFGGAGNLTLATTAQTLARNASAWLLSTGRRPASGGLYYTQGGLPGGDLGGCSNPEIAACIHPEYVGDTLAQRFLAGEIFGGMALSYGHNPDATQKTAIDTMYGGLFGGSGGPGADASYLAGYYPVTNKAKDFGFPWGWGGSYKWPAARLGGVATLVTRTYQIPFRLASVPTADRIRVTVTAPTAKTAIVTCTTSPCSITADTRQGNHSYQVDYLLGSTVLAPGQPLTLSVAP
jgi:hypothetical protein